MKKNKTFYFVHLFLILCALTIQSCASKKSTIIVNKQVLAKKYNNIENDKNILYLVDGKEVKPEYIKTIETYKIESVTVIKGEKDIAKYTDKKYDGVIIIKLKG